MVFLWMKNILNIDIDLKAELGLILNYGCMYLGQAKEMHIRQQN